jgi:rubrerythrin
MSSAVSDNRLVGASVFEQRAFDSLLAHERHEQEVIAAYESFATEASSEAVRYLIGLILDDERRHHRALQELANTVRTRATFEERGARLPYLDVHRRDRRLLEQTRRFLAVERADRAELKRLARTVRDLGGELDVLVVNLLRIDTERHIGILRFIEHLVRRSPLR